MPLPHPSPSERAFTPVFDGLCGGGSRPPTLLHRRFEQRDTAGFTLIEVLVALTVVAVTLSAIGSLVAVTIRGARSVGGHLALVESTRGIMTGLPNRDDLTLGNFSGEAGGHRWRVDVLPFYADFVDPDKSTWIPQTVVVRVQSPSGPVLQLNTVRLRRKRVQ